MYYQGPLILTIKSEKAPYLSYSGGTVDVNLPTLDTQWILVSFRTPQPPVLIALRGEACGFTVSGKAGNWQLKSNRPLAQWVRVCLPFGTTEFATSNVRELGQMTNAFEVELPYWEAQPPRLITTEIADDPNGVTVRYIFDKPGAVVPKPLVYAPLGGYPLEVQSQIEKLAAVDESGPLWVSSESTLVFRLPVRRVQVGRFLALGESTTSPVATVASHDYVSVASLAMECLMADRDSATQKLADDTIERYLTDTPSVAEPWTLQQFPFAANGQGIDLAAAHALLAQSSANARSATKGANALVTGLAWRRDWLTWQIWTSDRKARRRAEALAAVACALSPDTDRRMDAAMLQAGLASEVGFEIFSKRQGWIPELSPTFEPLSGLRRSLFALKSKAPEDPFALCLLRAPRVIGDYSFLLKKVSETEYELAWKVAATSPARIFIQSEAESTFTPLENLINLRTTATTGGNLLEFTPKEAGWCRIKVSGQVWKNAPLSIWPEPLYSE